MEIDLIKLSKLNLTINEWLTLLKIDLIDNQSDIPFTSTTKTLDSLVEKDLISIDKNTGQISLTADGLEILHPEEEKVNFDDLFNLYPVKTPNGRYLRIKNKTIGDKLTKEYKFLRDKYLMRVHDYKRHEQIIKATKVMLEDKKHTNSLDYLPQLEVYINKENWERYIREDGEVNNTTTYNSTEKL